MRFFGKTENCRAHLGTTAAATGLRSFFGISPSFHERFTGLSRVFERMPP
jgi:hypothetical protein